MDFKLYAILLKWLTFLLGDLKFVDCPTHKRHEIKCPTNINDYTEVYELLTLSIYKFKDCLKPHNKEPHISNFINCQKCMGFTADKPNIKTISFIMLFTNKIPDLYDKEDHP